MTKTFTRRTILGVSLLLALASTPPTWGEPITLGELHSLHSELLDEDRPFRIALPTGYENDGSKRYPVLVLLGGDNLFHYTSGVVQLLADEGAIPPMITVAVQSTARTRDLTTPWTQTDPPAAMQRFVRRAGGADRFLEFLATELVPHLESNYRTAPFRILVGRSLGGFFTLHTLFTAPDAFDGYLAISPSTHWNEGVILQELDAFLDREPSPSQKFLFVSLADEGGETLENYRQLVARLEYDAPANLHWSQRELIEDDHGTGFLPGVHRGLETVFEGWRPPSHVEARGLAGYDQHYQRLSERYGYDIPIPEWTIHVLGMRTLALGDPAEGIRILTENTRRYPDSAVARYRLASALEGEGQLSEAAKQLEHAVALGRASGDSDLARYEERLQAVHQALEAGADPPQE